jgi:predicted RNA-binding protein YlqC (UPF0109 family)
MANKPVDQEFLEYLVKSIVDHPDDVKVERKVDEMGVLLDLRVHQEDMGMLIGRQGSTAKALRTLLRIVGARHNARVNLKIEEPEGAAPRPQREKMRNMDEVVEDLKQL